MENTVWEPLTVSVEDAVKLSGLSRSFLFVCIADRRIASVKAGKRRLILLASLKAFLTPQER